MSIPPLWRFKCASLSSLTGPTNVAMSPRARLRAAPAVSTGGRLSGGRLLLDEAVREETRWRFRHPAGAACLPCPPTGALRIPRAAPPHWRGPRGRAAAGMTSFGRFGPAKGLTSFGRFGTAERQGPPAAALAVAGASFNFGPAGQQGPPVVPTAFATHRTGHNDFRTVSVGVPSVLRQLPQLVDMAAAAEVANGASANDEGHRVAIAMARPPAQCQTQRVPCNSSWIEPDRGCNGGPGGAAWWDIPPRQRRACGTVRTTSLWYHATKACIPGCSAWLWANSA